MESKRHPKQEDRLYKELKSHLGKEVLIITESDQLNLFGQTFRPIFCGKLIDVYRGHIELFPVIIKMVNAPFFEFPTPLCVPLEKVSQFTLDFDCDRQFPLT
ncbi:hypothetical protein [Guptibacillus hwajinpoensis]|uniref:Uncharacterized protein n=1 Tax=Guptibacillus hwajinpoensis TaxID=208199 RepID=A0A0J6CLB8_9BACL|nr:hypothetical protein [Alkalihalobacillus macyae]KMM37026.1 hypothetical protein AB986_14100 [Alkalihalobacillus macyae]